MVYKMKLPSLAARIGLAIVCPGLASLQAQPAGQAHAGSVAERWKSEVFPILENHCYDCHGDGISKGDLDFDDFKGIGDMIADRQRWKRIRSHIDQQLMPPLDEQQPTRAERDVMVKWIDDAVFPVDPNHPDPGRVTLRRLNRIEYENTMSDLLGMQVQVKELLPPDDSGYGFDNIGDVLTLSPLHLERFLEAARVSLDKAIELGPMPFPQHSIAGKEMSSQGGRPSGGHMHLLTTSEATVKHEFKHAGLYKITVVATGSKGGEEWPNMLLKLDGHLQGNWTVDVGNDNPKGFSKEVRIHKPQTLSVAVAFTNDFWDPKLAQNRDRNLMIRNVLIEGPLDGARQKKPESHRQIMGERGEGLTDEQYATQVFKRFARRAFRRPPEPGEAERYLHFVRIAKEQQQDVEVGIRQGLEAMLVSPAFLFREEPQPDPDNAEQVHLIGEHALASRLSYFLWSTMPDERLMKLADEGKLRANLEGEVNRMLNDWKAGRMVENFTGQWLQLRNLTSRTLSREEFPKFKRGIRFAFAEETQRLFAYLIEHDRPLTELLSADYTFVNEQLANHYGIKGVKTKDGKDFVKVSLQETPRRGLLGHASLHMITSHPMRTSPVLRGKYVLENILNQEPPPPPPNIEQLDPASAENQGKTLREQMELHRQKPDCASCHALMDPIGFGLENFNADGSYRTHADGKPVDASGELVGGRKFVGADQLREILIKDHRGDFHRAVATKMLTYALGRGVDWYDKPAIEQIVKQTEANGGSARAIIHAIINSVPFQKRRGEG